MPEIDNLVGLAHARQVSLGRILLGVGYGMWQNGGVYLYRDDNQNINIGINYTKAVEIIPAYMLSGFLNTPITTDIAYQFGGPVLGVAGAIAGVYYNNWELFSICLASVFPGPRAGLGLAGIIFLHGMKDTYKDIIVYDLAKNFANYMFYQENGVEGDLPLLGDGTNY